MGQTIGLVKSYPIENAAGVGKYCCVVQGAADGNCKLPTAQNAPGFLGVTVEAQPNQYKGVPVCRTGIYGMTAGGAITRGDRVAINSAAGDVYSVEALIEAAPGAPARIHVVGRAEISAVAGDIFPVFIEDYTVNIAAS
jgi:hypothetical protein